MYNFTDYFSMMAGNRDKSHHGKNSIVTITLKAIYVKICARV